MDTKLYKWASSLLVLVLAQEKAHEPYLIAVTNN
jgi:hypothetical protein